jgi:hypothetical protein
MKVQARYLLGHERKSDEESARKKYVNDAATNRDTARITDRQAGLFHKTPSQFNFFHGG